MDSYMQAKLNVSQSKELVDVNAIANTVSNASSLISNIAQTNANRKAEEWVRNRNTAFDSSAQDPNFFKDEEGNWLDSEGMKAKIASFNEDYLAANPLTRFGGARDLAFSMIKDKDAETMVLAQSYYIQHANKEKEQLANDSFNSVNNTSYIDYALETQMVWRSGNSNKYTEEMREWAFNAMYGKDDDPTREVDAKCFIYAQSLLSLGYTNKEISDMVAIARDEFAIKSFKDLYVNSYTDVINGGDEYAFFKEVYDAVDLGEIPGYSKVLTDEKKAEIKNSIKSEVNGMKEAEQKKAYEIYSKYIFPEISNLGYGKILTTEVLNTAFDNAKKNYGFNINMLPLDTKNTLYKIAGENDSWTRVFDCVTQIDSLTGSEQEIRDGFLKLFNSLSSGDQAKLMAARGDEGTYFDGSFSDFSNQASFLMEYGYDIHGNKLDQGIKDSEGYLEAEKLHQEESDRELQKASREMSASASLDTYTLTVDDSVKVGDSEAAYAAHEAYWTDYKKKEEKRLREDPENNYSESAIQEHLKAINEMAGAYKKSIDSRLAAYTKGKEEDDLSLDIQLTDSALSAEYSAVKQEAENKVLAGDIDGAETLVLGFIEGAKTESLANYEKDSPEYKAKEREWDALTKEQQSFYQGKRAAKARQDEEKLKELQSELTSAVSEKYEVDITNAINDEDWDKALSLYKEDFNYQETEDLKKATSEKEKEIIREKYKTKRESAESYINGLKSEADKKVQEKKDSYLKDIETLAYDDQLSHLETLIENAKNTNNFEDWRILNDIKHDLETSHAMEEFEANDIPLDSEQVVAYLEGRANSKADINLVVDRAEEEYEQEQIEADAKRAEELAKAKDAAILSDANNVSTAIIFDLANDMDLSEDDRKEYIGYATGIVVGTIKESRTLSPHDVTTRMESLPDYLKDEWNEFYEANKLTSTLSYTEMFGAWVCQIEAGITDIDVSDNWIENKSNEILDSYITYYDGFVDRNASAYVDGVTVRERYGNEKDNFYKYIETAKTGWADSEDKVASAFSKDRTTELVTAYARREISKESALESMEIYKSEKSITKEDYDYFIDMIDGGSIPYIQDKYPKFSQDDEILSILPPSVLNGAKGESYLKNTAMGRFLSSEVSKVVLDVAGRMMAGDPEATYTTLISEIHDKVMEISSDSIAGWLTLGYSEGSNLEVSSYLTTIKDNKNNFESWKQGSNNLIASPVIDAVDQILLDTFYDVVSSGKTNTLTDSIQGFMELGAEKRADSTVYAFALATGIFNNVPYNFTFEEGETDRLWNDICAYADNMDSVSIGLLYNTAMHLLSKQAEYSYVTSSNAPVGYHSGNLAMNGHDCISEYNSKCEISGMKVSYKDENGKEIKLDAKYTTDSGISELKNILRNEYIGFEAVGIPYEQASYNANQIPEFVEASKVIELTMPDKILVPYYSEKGLLTCSVVDKGDDGDMVNICYSAIGTKLENLEALVNARGLLGFKLAKFDSRINPHFENYKKPLEDYKNNEEYISTNKIIKDITDGEFEIDFRPDEHGFLNLNIVRSSNSESTKFTGEY